MYKVLGISLFLIALSFGVHGQDDPEDWQDMMINRSSSMKEIQKAFNTAWEGKSYVKGQGYKQFKRWEYFNYSRLYGMDKHPPADITWQAVKQLKLNKSNASSRSLGSWTTLGPTSVIHTPNAAAPGLGRVNVIKVSPSNPNVIFIGAPAGGLWKTENGGDSWTPLTDYLMSIGISGIEIDPNNEDIMYIGTGDGDGSDTYSIGVLKSTDGGNTWEETGLTWQTSQTRNFNKLILDPENSNIIYAATSNGLYKSVDAGDNWNNILNGNIEDVEFHPLDNSIIYACTDDFFKSTNAGASFENINGGLPSPNTVRRYKMAVSPDEPDYVYLVAGDQSTDGFLGLYRSTNSGEDFELRSDSPNILHWSDDGNGTGGQSWYDLAIAVDPNNANRLFVGGVNVWGSEDGGTSWQISSHWVITNPLAYTHADIHTLSYQGGAIYCGSDGGIFKTTNEGISWDDLSDGLGITQFYRLGLSETNPDLIIGGTQDNGTFLLKNGDWYNVLGADGMECLIYPNNQNRMIGSIYFGNFSRSLDGGESWDGFSDGISEDGAWVTPFEMDPEDNGVILAGFDNVWRYESGSWEAISNFGNGNINALRVAPSDNNFIYVSKGTQIYRTTNGGDEWDNISFGLPGIFIEYIEVDPTDPNTVYVVHSGYSNGQKIHKTSDGGENWENISFNLPNVPVNCVEFQNGSNGGIYVGTDIGVFYTDDNLVNWTPYMSGLPNTVVTELEVHDNSQKIRAATYGRGIWESPLYTGFNEAPTAEFDANRRVICEGDSVVFEDLSIGNDGGWQWSFEGGFPSSSDEQYPVVFYNTPGLYEVSLVVDNANGSGSETKTEYIQVIPQQGQPIPFVEDFENESIPGLEWFVENEDGDLTWELTNSNGNFGPSSAWINNFNNPADQLDELVSTTIDLSDASDVLLTFYVAYAERDGDEDDRLRVFVSKDCGANWSLRKTLTPSGLLASADPSTEPFSPESDQWNYIEVSNILETFLVENFKVKFRWESDGGNNVYLDDINLTEVVSSENIDAKSINTQLYPNPTNGNSVLEFTLTEQSSCSIFLTDMTGRRVLDVMNSQLEAGVQNIQMETAALAKGSYIVVLNVNGKEVMQKLLKD